MSDDFLRKADEFIALVEREVEADRLREEFQGRRDAKKRVRHGDHSQDSEDA